MKNQAEEVKSDIDNPPPSSFTLFRHLPVELRIYIWELSHSAVIGDGLVYRISQKGKFDRFISGEQSVAARTILLLDPESRHIALNALPDTIPHPNGKGVIRANLRRDLFLLCDKTISMVVPSQDSVFGCLCNLAVAVDTLGKLTPLINRGVFPSLKHLYLWPVTAALPPRSSVGVPMRMPSPPPRSPSTMWWTAMAVAQLGIPAGSHTRIWTPTRKNCLLADGLTDKYTTGLMLTSFFALRRTSFLGTACKECRGYASYGLGNMGLKTSSCSSRTAEILSRSTFKFGRLSNGASAGWIGSKKFFPRIAMRTNRKSRTVKKIAVMRRCRMSRVRQRQ